jgi:phosphoglycolate phosphatase
MPPPFRLIVFDLDGTLVDSRRDLAEATNAMLSGFGCPALNEEAIGRMVGDGAATLVARALEASGCRPEGGLPAALERFLAIYGGQLTAHTRPYPGVPEALGLLRARATLAVLTNKPLASTLEILERLELKEHFAGDLIVGGDGPFPRKPDPAGLIAITDRAAVPLSDTILVGDSPIDWRTARGAGCSVCLASYGFGFAAFPGATEVVEGIVVRSAAELIAVL